MREKPLGQTMNTYCRKCGTYTASKLVNLPKAQEMECRCAVCGKFKDYYSYRRDTGAEIDDRVRLNRLFKVICAVSFLIFAAVMLVNAVWGVKHETAALITIILSALTCFGSAVLIDEKSDKKRKDIHKREAQQ